MWTTHRVGCGGAERAPIREAARSPGKRGPRCFVTQDRNRCLVQARKLLPFVPTGAGPGDLRETAHSSGPGVPGIPEDRAFPYRAWRCSGSYAAAFPRGTPPPDELAIIEEESVLTRAIHTLSLALRPLQAHDWGPSRILPAERADTVEYATALLKLRVPSSAEGAGIRNPWLPVGIVPRLGLRACSAPLGGRVLAKYLVSEAVVTPEGAR